MIKFVTGFIEDENEKANKISGTKGHNLKRFRFFVHFYF